MDETFPQKLGKVLCWRDTDALQFYRELRWRMVKMVRNAYGMAIPEKNCRLVSRKINEKHDKVLDLGREKKWRGGDYTVLRDLSRQIDW